MLPPFPAVKFSHVHVDIVDPLPAIKEGHTHLLTIIDRSTRWPEVILPEGSLYLTGPLLCM